MAVVNEHKRRKLAELVTLEAACVEGSTDAPALLALGRAYLELGMHEQAVAALDRSIRAGVAATDAFGARMLQARALELSHAAWPDVLERYLAAHGDDPSRPEPLAALAEAYADRALDGPSHLFAKRAIELDRGTASLEPSLRSRLEGIVLRVGPALEPKKAKAKRPAKRTATVKRTGSRKKPP